MDINDSLVHKLLEQTVGIKIEVLSNNYNELPVSDGSMNTSQEIVFQIKEEEPDISATDIDFEPGGKVTLSTRNRGRGAETWMSLLQGKRHIKRVK